LPWLPKSAARAIIISQKPIKSSAGVCAGFLRIFTELFYKTFEFFFFSKTD
jgi:hypothetical protein